MALGPRVDAGWRAMITVRLPSTLKVGASSTLTFAEPLASVAELVDALDRRIPGFREQLDDSVFNFAVNDEILLHRARERRLSDGDTVEIIPTISGGETGSSRAGVSRPQLHVLAARGDTGLQSGAVVALRLAARDRTRVCRERPLA